MLCYVFSNAGLATAANEAIKSLLQFPFSGKIKDTIRPDKQQTIDWQPVSFELTSGERAIKIVEDSTWDYREVPEQGRITFLETHGTDIRDVLLSEIVQVAEDL